MKPANATLLFLDAVLDLRPNRFEELADIVLANKKVRSKAAHRKTQLCLRQQSLTPPRRAYAKVEPRFCLLRHLTRLTAMKLSEIVGEIDDSTGNPLLQVFTAPVPDH